MGSTSLTSSMLTEIQGRFIGDLKDFGKFGHKCYGPIRFLDS